MRIISGKYKSRRIVAPKKLPVRPTTDRAKESLFNILHNRFYLDSVKVLDLFAGTGNISYEFASRGALEVMAVDANAGCVQFIAKTAKGMELPIHVIKSDVFAFLEKTGTSYDIVFADPPYDMDITEFQKMVHLVMQGDLVSVGGHLIIEHADRTDLSQLPNFKEQRKYGGTVFSFFGAAEPKSQTP